jgi:hypothetical protein
MSGKLRDNRLLDEDDQPLRQVAQILKEMMETVAQEEEDAMVLQWLFTPGRVHRLPVEALEDGRIRYLVDKNISPVAEA